MISWPFVLQLSSVLQLYQAADLLFINPEMLQVCSGRCLEYLDTEETDHSVDMVENIALNMLKRFPTCLRRVEINLKRQPGGGGVQVA